MKFWSSFDPDYIQEKLAEILDAKKRLSLWQSDEDEREKFDAQLVEIGQNTCKISLKAYNSSYGTINVQKPLYIHEESEDCLFRKDIYQLSGDFIKFKTPLEVRFRDKRVTQRFYYKYQDYKNVTFYREGEEDDRHSYILTDISTAGLSFVMPQKDRWTLHKGNELILISLTDQNIPDGHKAEVVYVTPFHLPREPGTSLIQVGLKFTDALDAISYRSIGNVIKKKQEKVKGLDTDKFNGLNPDQFEQKIIQIHNKNKQLAMNIKERVEDLDRLRYLTTEMKREFLLAVNHDLLAAALRLSSKELILDLLSEVTDSMREEFLEKLDIQKPASAINKAQDEICKVIHQKEKSGELVLDPMSFVKMV